MLEQAVQQTTSQDYEQVVSSMNSLQIQLWFCMIALPILFAIVVGFIKAEWAELKQTLTALGVTVQKHDNKFAYMEGEGTATSKVAEEMEKASMRIAGAIERKYKARER